MLAIALAVSGAYAFMTAKTHVPAVQGIRDLATFMERIAPVQGLIDVDFIGDDKGAIGRSQFYLPGANLKGAGGMLVQGIGTEPAWLVSNVAVGARLRLDVRVTDGEGRPVKFDSNDSASDGGPRLVAGSRPAIPPAADGLVNPENPSFLWNWGARHNPRTMAGVDGHGRILLATVDGRRLGYSVGLSGGGIPADDRAGSGRRDEPRWRRVHRHGCERSIGRHSIRSRRGTRR